MLGLSISAKSVSLNSPRQVNACAASCPGDAKRPCDQVAGDVVNVYTAEEIAGKLRVKYKTVLRLIERGYLKTLPGIRHKRITEAEFERYLANQSLLAGAAATMAAVVPPHGVSSNNPSTRPSNAAGVVSGQIVVSPTAKVVAPPLAPLKAKRK